jgi:hypothetical protein
MLLHPLLDVARAGRGCGSGIGRGRGSSLGVGLCGPGLGPSLGACLSALCGAILSKAAGIRRGGSAQEDSCRAEKKPG